jgi:hypothetical protein
VGKTGGRKPKYSFLELNDKIRREKTLAGLNKNIEFSQQEKALLSLILCLIHALGDSKILDKKRLMRNILDASGALVDHKDVVAADLLREIYIQLTVEFG